jgi:hypothetical protein
MYAAGYEMTEHVSRRPRLEFQAAELTRYGATVVYKCPQLQSCHSVVE